MMSLCYLLPVFVSRPGIPFPSVVQRFASERVECCQGRLISYRLYVPKTDGSRELPLLIWFHGMGEAGLDNQEQLSWLELVFGDGTTNKDIPCYVVAVQTPAKRYGWFGNLEVDPLKTVEVVDQHVCDVHAIDTDRVYLAGISQGAVAAWRYARRRPTRYAAVLLLGMNASVRVSKSFGRGAIWAFQSVADGTSRVEAVRAFVHQLNQRDVNAQATIIMSPDHDCWTIAFRRYHAFAWLLQHRRLAPPGADVQGQRLVWVVVTLSLIVLCILGASSEECLMNSSDQPES